MGHSDLQRIKLPISGSIFLEVSVISCGGDDKKEVSFTRFQGICEVIRTLSRLEVPDLWALFVFIKVT